MLAGVIGWPVEHSRSPAIHNAACKATGVDMVYAAFPVEPGRSEEAVAAIRTLGLRGLSVTMPHKQGVIPALDEVSEVARILDAVNHITNTDGHVVGDNTDGAGFLSGLQSAAGRSVAGRTIGVVGAGGAARAIIHASCGADAAEVIVVARSPERANHAVSLGAQARHGEHRDLAACDVVVNATPVGMEGSGTHGQSPIDVSQLSEDAIVVDIVYNPLETPLLHAARARRLVGIDGLAMLVGQAAAQFEAWTGVAAPVDVMRDAAIP
ncbi:MAG: shikimate dehydrogenase [Verrucomicrobiales bacterium]|jgi:shikimate dehydrogenase